MFSLERKRISLRGISCILSHPMLNFFHEFGPGSYRGATPCYPQVWDCSDCKNHHSSCAQCAHGMSAKHVALPVWKSFQGPLDADPEADSVWSQHFFAIPFHSSARPSVVLPLNGYSSLLIHSRSRSS